MKPFPFGLSAAYTRPSMICVLWWKALLFLHTNVNAQISPDSVSLSGDSIVIEDSLAVVVNDSILQIIPDTAYRPLMFRRNQDLYWQAWDTSLYALSFTDPVARDHYELAHAGNIGLPATHFLYHPDIPLGFHLGFRGFEAYTFQPENVLRFNNNKPFTEIHFMIGQKREQQFRVIHSQTIRQKYQFIFHYHRIASVGFYQRQRSILNPMALIQQYRQGRWRIDVELYNNNFKIEENGGVVDRSLFQRDTNLVSRELIDISLERARTHHRQIQILSRQTYVFGQATQKESATSVYHEIGFLQCWQLFEDARPSNPYYQTWYEVDSFRANDTVRWRYQSRMIEQKAGLNIRFKKSDGSPIPFSFEGEVGQQWLRISAPYGFRENQGLLFVRAAVASPSGSGDVLQYRIETRSFLSGYHQGDFDVRGMAGVKLWGSQRFMAQAVYSIRESDWIYQRWQFLQETFPFDFRKVQTLKMEGVWMDTLRFLQGGLQYLQTNQALYWKAEGRPAQWNATEVLFRIWVKKRWEWNHLGWDHHYSLQTTSNTELFRTPLFWGRMGLYYDAGLFKRALNIRLGMNAYYYTSYKPFEYLPHTGQFHWQDEMNVNTYPLLDAYMAANIKTFNIILQMTHLSQGWFGRSGYFVYAGYPAFPRSFRVAIQWRFHD